MQKVFWTHGARSPKSLLHHQNLSFAPVQQYNPISHQRLFARRSPCMKDLLCTLLAALGIFPFRAISQVRGTKARKRRSCWGGGLPCEWGGSQKIDTSLEAQGRQTFGGMSGKLPGYPRNLGIPTSLRTNSLCCFFAILPR